MVSCYLRHLKDVVREAGVGLVVDNRHTVDRAFHEIACVWYSDYASVWRRGRSGQDSGPRARRRLTSGRQAGFARNRSLT